MTRRWAAADPRAWWESALVYQIYPRSWVDSNGDGIGDLPGIRQRLDYLEWLGIDAIWLNPITPSPNADWGYDVADYCDVDPELGTLDDLDGLIADAGARGIHVILDLVPNHTSNAHEWFVDSRSSRSSAKRDWYVWCDAASDGGPPNNWLRALGEGPAWTLDRATQQYYMHSFLPEQPDLNWWNEDVRRAFDRILSFWFDRGVSGFRLDVVHALIHDPELRGNPPATPEDHPQVTRIGQRQVFNVNRPEVHDIIRRWRRIADAHPDNPILVGETYLFELQEVAKYYGSTNDELHLALNFPFMFCGFTVKELSEVVAATVDLLPQHAVAAWAASNHDAGRFMTRWCRDDEARARCALLILLTLPGTAFLYYGDEIAMRDVSVPRERLRDPAGLARWPDPGRDRARTPMQWSAHAGGGFTEPGVDPWLTWGDHVTSNVADQRADNSSYLSLTRNLIALRRGLRGRTYQPHTASGTLWGYRCASDTDVWVNLSGEAACVDIGEGSIMLATHSSVQASSDGRTLQLPPQCGAVVEHRFQTRVETDV